MIVTLETDNGPVTMDAVCISRCVQRNGRTPAGLLTTVIEVWRDASGQEWEYTENFIQPPMPFAFLALIEKSSRAQDAQHETAIVEVLR